MEGGNILFNVSKDKGGGIYYNGNGLRLENVNIALNLAINGGGLYTDSTGMTAKECTFYNNTATKNGGGCYINSSSGVHLFFGPSFTYNTAGEDGGAMCINANRTCLIGAFITENRARDDGGGIYVDSDNNLSVQGCVYIDYNESVKTENHNLCLQEGSFSQAYLHSGGLYDGSLIALSKTGGLDNDTLVMNCTQYEAEHYFKANEGSLKFKVRNIEFGSYYASVFSEGVVRNIIILSAALVLIMAMGVLIYKRKRTAKAR